MMKYGLIFAIAIAMAPAAALAATSGTVRMDLFDDVADDNRHGDHHTINGQLITGSSGFFLFDIDNNTILDAEFNILTGKNMMVARTLDKTAFSFSTTAGRVNFGLANATIAELSFDNRFGRLSGNASSHIGFVSEVANFQIRVITAPGWSPSFHVLEAHPGLVFTPTVVPEPSTAVLLGLASLGVFGTRRRRS